MDELSFVIQTIIDNELDDLILDLVYEIHSSLKGIPDDQLEINNSNHGSQFKTFVIPFSQSPTMPIEKQTCICPHCGQSNIIAIRFAYHLAKCLGVGRRSSRQAKNRIVDQVMTITASSDDSRSNGDEYHNGEGNNGLPEDGESCTDSTSSSSNHHRRIVNEDHEYTGDFDNDEEDEDDWKPKKKKRKSTMINLNKKKKKKEEILVISQPISELDFHNCIIPLDKICPRTQHLVIPLVTSNTLSNGEHIYFENQSLSSTSHCRVRSPLNLVEDEPSSATSIIMFQEDTQR